MILALMLNAVMHKNQKSVSNDFLSAALRFVGRCRYLASKILSPNVGLINDIRYQMGLDPIFLWVNRNCSIPWSSYPTSGRRRLGFDHLFSRLNEYRSALVRSCGNRRGWKVEQTIQDHASMPDSTIGILLIFSLSGILNAGFDQIWLMQSPATLSVSEILDTYVLKQASNKDN